MRTPAKEPLSSPLRIKPKKPVKTVATTSSQSTSAMLLSGQPSHSQQLVIVNSDTGASETIHISTPAPPPVQLISTPTSGVFSNPLVMPQIVNTQPTQYVLAANGQLLPIVQQQPQPLILTSAGLLMNNSVLPSSRKEPQVIIISSNTAEISAKKSDVPKIKAVETTIVEKAPPTPPPASRSDSAATNTATTAKSIRINRRRFLQKAYRRVLEKSKKLTVVQRPSPMKSSDILAKATELIFSSSDKRLEKRKPIAQNQERNDQEKETESISAANKEEIAIRMRPSIGKKFPDDLGPQAEGELHLEFDEVNNDNDDAMQLTTNELVLISGDFAEDGGEISSVPMSEHVSENLTNFLSLSHEQQMNELNNTLFNPTSKSSTISSANETQSAIENTQPTEIATSNVRSVQTVQNVDERPIMISIEGPRHEASSCSKEKPRQEPSYSTTSSGSGSANAAASQASTNQVENAILPIPNLMTPSANTHAHPQPVTERRSSSSCSDTHGRYTDFQPPINHRDHTQHQHQQRSPSAATSDRSLTFTYGHEQSDMQTMRVSQNGYIQEQNRRKSQDADVRQIPPNSGHGHSQQIHPAPSANNGYACETPQQQQQHLQPVTSQSNVQQQSGTEPNLATNHSTSRPQSTSNQNNFFSAEALLRPPDSANPIIPPVNYGAQTNFGHFPPPPHALPHQQDRSRSSSRSSGPFFAENLFDHQNAFIPRLDLHRPMLPLTLHDHDNSNIGISKSRSGGANEPAQVFSINNQFGDNSFQQHQDNSNRTTRHASGNMSTTNQQHSFFSAESLMRSSESTNTSSFSNVMSPSNYHQQAAILPNNNNKQVDRSRSTNSRSTSRANNASNNANNQNQNNNNMFSSYSAEALISSNMHNFNTVPPPQHNFAAPLPPPIPSPAVAVNQSQERNRSGSRSNTRHQTQQVQSNNSNSNGQNMMVTPYTPTFSAEAILSSSNVPNFNTVPPPPTSNYHTDTNFGHLHPPGQNERRSHTMARSAPYFSAENLITPDQSAANMPSFMPPRLFPLMSEQQEPVAKRARNSDPSHAACNSTNQFAKQSRSVSSKSSSTSNNAAAGGESSKSSYHSKRVS